VEEEDWVDGLRTESMGMAKSSTPSSDGDEFRKKRTRIRIVRRKTTIDI